MAATILVSFPVPSRLVRHAARWRDPNALIEPEAPGLQPWVEALSAQLAGDLPPREALRVVERFVHQNVPYAWDWDVWVNSDYLPTVAEVLEKGREDCDGRAVVAASLLRRLGYKADLATDFAHMWVVTDQGEVMSPGKTKAVVTTPEGVTVNSGALAQLVRTLPHGIAVFPLGRELLVLLVAWFLLLRRGVSIGRAVLGLVLLFNGLLFVRLGGADYIRPVVWASWVGLANGVLAAAIIGGSPRPGARNRV